MRTSVLLALATGLLCACAALETTPESSRDAIENLRSTQHQPAD